MTEPIITVQQVKDNLLRKLEELPVEDAYALLERIVQFDFIRPVRYTTLSMSEILDLGKKPLPDELAHKILDANDNKERLEPLLREHIRLIYEHQCKWIEYLYGATDKKPFTIPDPV